jgi:hypothetical protein
MPNWCTSFKPHSIGVTWYINNRRKSLPIELSDGRDVAIPVVGTFPDVTEFVDAVGEVTVDAEVAEVTVEAAVGEVTVDAAGAEVTVELAVGEVTVEGAVGEVTVEAAVTEVTVEVAVGEVTVDAEGAEVTVDAAVDVAVALWKGSSDDVTTVVGMCTPPVVTVDGTVVDCNDTEDTDTSLLLVDALLLTDSCDEVLSVIPWVTWIGLVKLGWTLVSFVLEYSEYNVAFVCDVVVVVHELIFVTLDEWRDVFHDEVVPVSSWTTIEISLALEDEVLFDNINPVLYSDEWDCEVCVVVALSARLRVVSLDKFWAATVYVLEEWVCVIFFAAADSAPAVETGIKSGTVYDADKFLVSGDVVCAVVECNATLDVELSVLLFDSTVLTVWFIEVVLGTKRVVWCLLIVDSGVLVASCTDW